MVTMVPTVTLLAVSVNFTNVLYHKYIICSRHFLDRHRTVPVGDIDAIIYSFEYVGGRAKRLQLCSATDPQKAILKCVSA